MNDVRRAAERGHAQHGWLESYHSFSFADYYASEHMGYGALRVINEDRVQPGSGFGTHHHRDMEIITYVLDGALAHEDSIGNGSTMVPGDVQRMSAGSGVRHSEYNHETAGVTHFLQIWIEPSQRGGAPSYEQKHFDASQKRGRLRLIVSPDGRDGSVSMRQDAYLYAGLFDAGERARLDIGPRRKAYIHVARGVVAVNGELLAAGDAMKIDGGTIEIGDGEGGEVLVFVLPPA